MNSTLREAQTISPKGVFNATAMVLVAGLTLLGCMPDAERDNPFDPKSPQYRYPDSGTLTGRVTTYPPAKGIEGVRVALSSPGGSGITDGDGFYTVDDIPDGTYEATASKPGFAEADTTVHIVAGHSSTVNFSLDGSPYFLGTSITSEHDKPPPFDDRYFFHFDALVDDPDGSGDIDSVVVHVAALGFTRRLERIGETGSFHVTVSPNDVTEGAPERLVGQAAVFSVWDRFKKRADTPPQHLVRIIYASPTGISPEAGEQVDPQPTLQWEPFSASFSFTYTIDIRSAFAPGWHSDGIPSDVTSVVVSDSLSTQSIHRWEVWVVDDFGNTSKSPFVEFFVGGGM